MGPLGYPTLTRDPAGNEISDAGFKEAENRMEEMDEVWLASYGVSPSPYLKDYGFF